MSDSATAWIIAHQAPLSMGFSWQECWRELPYPPPGDLPNPGMEPVSLMSPVHVQAGSLPLAPPGTHVPMEETWVRSLGQENPDRKSVV